MMQPTSGSTSTPVWRRGPGPTKRKRSKRNTAAVTLLPITPLHEVVPGEMEVDDELTRVVYLAPLTTTAAEKYLARTRHQVPPHDSSNDGERSGEDEGCETKLPALSEPKDEGSPSSRALLANPLLRKLLAEHERRISSRKARQDKLIGAQVSVFDQPSSYEETVADRKTRLSPVKLKPRTEHPEDEQIEQLKRYVRSIPHTDSDIEEFWQAMKTFQRLQREDRASLLRDHSSPMGFNIEAAWNKKLLEERHQLWVRTHDERLEATRTRKAAEDDRQETRILESTTEFRAHMRVLREMRMRLMIQSQLILPTVMLAAITQNWLEHLQQHWKQQQLTKRVRGIIRFWCKQRKSRSEHAKAARLLIHWLQKSVAVKSVALRVFRGIRNYVRRVKQVQRLWKVKYAKRLRNYLLLERLWAEEETLLVDQANEEFERHQTQVEAKAVRSKKRMNSKSSTTNHSNTQWLTYVSSEIRTATIKDFVRCQEKEFVRLFRQQEDDLFPQLVQTLRDEYPSRARSYIKAIANGHALLGGVYAALSRFPGSLIDVEQVKPFDMHKAPVRDLILSARANSPLDPTGARFGLLQSSDDDKKNKVTLFLQQRREFRDRLPPHAASEQSFCESVPKSASQPRRKQTTEKTIQYRNTHEEGKLLDASDEANTTSKGPLIQSTMQQNAPSFGLVVVCSSFRYLPSFSGHTEDVARSLYTALTDSHFCQFMRRGTKLLLNPSLIEFQDTLKELVDICAIGNEETAFFMCFMSRGARVTGGVNEGSYILFYDSRVSSEEELVLSALHEQDLAKLIHEIPCKNKLITLELCQVKEESEKSVENAPRIVNRVHESCIDRLYNNLVKLELARQQSVKPVLTEADLLTDSRLFNTIILHSCNIATESPLRDPVDGVSCFLHRLNDAFHGAAVKMQLEGGIEDLFARTKFQMSDICSYVKSTVESDAVRKNESVKREYTKQLRTKYEKVVEFEDLTHTPQLYGFERAQDFPIGDIPASPESAPTAPRFVSAKTNSLTLSWSVQSSGFLPTTSAEVPTILGYHIQVRGGGRACEEWRRASDFQVLSYDEVVHEKKLPLAMVTVHGLPSDMDFYFRIRARTSGGWGPFSDKSETMRTLSFASVYDTFSTVTTTVSQGGVLSLLDLMSRHEHNRDILRWSVEYLSRSAIKDLSGSRVDPKVRLLPNVEAHMKVVTHAVKAALKFCEDVNLARSSCLFIGRLAQYDEAWRKQLVTIREPFHVVGFVQAVAKRFRQVNDISTTALWALERLRGVSARCRTTPDEAAKRIQGMYRTCKARQHARTLANATYTQLVDPTTGCSYYYNFKTGSTSWSLPSFL